MSVYIASCAQISVQKALCSEWFDSPIHYNEPYIRALDPDYKAFVNPVAARRMGLILKRAMATSRTALQESGVEMPDAVITATGLGCIENTEKFLRALSEQGEHCLQPTFFINSTHNTIGSYIAVQLKCHAYNNTHVHKGISFESALYDAMLQFELKKINSALLGAHDEMTPDYFKLLRRIGFWDGSFAGETAVSFVLKNTRKDSGKQVEIAGMDILYQPDAERMKAALDTICATKNLSLNDIDLLVTGRNNHPDNKQVYESFESRFGFREKTAAYKELFGESFTASAFGLCYAYECLKRGVDPCGRKVKNILLYNHYENKDHTFILLSSC